MVSNCAYLFFCTINGAALSLDKKDSEHNLFPFEAEKRKEKVLQLQQAEKMGYRSDVTDVTLLVSKKGFKALKEFIGRNNNGQ